MLLIDQLFFFSMKISWPNLSVTLEIVFLILPELVYQEYVRRTCLPQMCYKIV